jgi:hypothetical protein
MHDARLSNFEALDKAAAGVPAWKDPTTDYVTDAPLPTPKTQNTTGLDAPFVAEQVFDLSAGMQRFAIDARARSMVLRWTANPNTGAAAAGVVTLTVAGASLQLPTFTLAAGDFLAKPIAISDPQGSWLQMNPSVGATGILIVQLCEESQGSEYQPATLATYPIGASGFLTQSTTLALAALAVTAASPRSTRQSVTLSAPSTNTAVVWIGGAGVTVGAGLALSPGQSITIPLAAAAGQLYGISGTTGQVVSDFENG